MTTVQRIKKLAQEQGISMTYLCKRIGLSSRTYFNDIEKHGREIPLDKLTIIASALNTTVAYLKGETEEQKKPPAIVGEELSEGQRKLIEFARSVPEDKIDLVLKVMQSIVEAD